jgi:hypothetical protein
MQLDKTKQENFAQGGDSCKIFNNKSSVLNLTGDIILLSESSVTGLQQRVE